MAINITEKMAGKTKNFRELSVEEAEALNGNRKCTIYNNIKTTKYRFDLDVIETWLGDDYELKFKNRDSLTWFVEEKTFKTVNKTLMTALRKEGFAVNGK